MRFLLALFLWVNCAFAGQETQNGAGPAEQNFAYALTQLKSLYNMCLSSKLCLETPFYQGLLRLVFEHLDEEFKFNSRLLQYLPGTDDGFAKDGPHRIAYTGLITGSTIFINQDLIYRQEGSGRVTPYSVSEAIEVLTHELCHHIPLMGEDQIAATIAAKVRAFFEMNSRKITVDNFMNTFGRANITINAFRLGDDKEDGPSLFWLNVNDKFFDLNSEIESKLSCPKNGIEGVGRLENYRFGRMYWGDETSDDKFVYFPLHAQAVLKCVYPPTWYGTRYRIKIIFKFNRENDMSLTYVEKAIKIEIKNYKGDEQ